MLIAFWRSPSSSPGEVTRVTVWSRRRSRRVLIIGGEVGHTVAAKIAGHPDTPTSSVPDDGDAHRQRGPALPVGCSTAGRDRCGRRSIA
jgi:hypothetical protein